MWSRLQPGSSSRQSRRPGVFPTLAVLGCLVVGLSACDGLLDVDLPGQTEATELDDPSMAAVLVTSVQGDFECAYSRYVRQSGLITGELLGSLRGLTNIPYLQRDVRPIHTGYGEATCGSSSSLYTPVSTARFTADDVLDRLQGFTDDEVSDRDRLLARSALYAGYSYVVFGEGFCRAAFDGGPAQTPEETLRLAIDRFTTAIQHASEAGADDVLHAAYVGRARARIAVGEASAAASDAREVPEGFELLVDRSDAESRRENAVFVDNYRSEQVTVGPKYWDVRWEDVSDPRVDVVDAGRVTGGDNQTPLWQQTKYMTPDAPIRLASHDEAQLIIAEAEGGETAVDIINDFHAAAGIPPFESEDPDDIADHIVEERRRALFLEGHRMGDLRRFGGFAEAASHGGTHPYQGLPFGSMTCFPLPNVEISNNSNISS